MLCTWGGCVLDDQVGCSWLCWRHPNASGVGVKVASAMKTLVTRLHKATFWSGGVRVWAVDVADRERPE